MWSAEYFTRAPFKTFSRTYLRNCSKWCLIILDSSGKSSRILFEFILLNYNEKTLLHTKKKDPFIVFFLLISTKNELSYLTVSFLGHFINPWWVCERECMCMCVCMHVPVCGFRTFFKAFLVFMWMYIALYFGEHM